MATLVATQENPILPDALTAPVRRYRVESVDLLRGSVMILMALDHTRDFLGVTSVNPTDLSHATAPLFFTRWITHLCAPVFFLLTGTSAYLSLKRKSRNELSRFLFSRGLWLIFLELTLFRCLAFQFNFDYHVTVLNVLWAIGWAMIVLSVLVHLPLSLTTAVSLVMIASHNSLDSIQFANPIWTIFHRPGFLLMNPERSVLIAYPLVPWIGVTGLGYSFGQVFAWTSERRRAFLLRMGLGLTAAFILLRSINVYGDPARWTSQKSALFTTLSFLNTTKYPPSLLFLLMTLGPALVLLWVADTQTPKFLRPTIAFGKVPMFYFLLHIPLIHLIAVGVCYSRYGHVHWMFESPSVDQFPVSCPPGWGFSLPIVYLIWVCVVLALYPVCHWFAGVKERRREGWLSYF
jgi:uncharacterized membrane protein